MRVKFLVMIKQLYYWFLCSVLGDHDWTSAFLEGIEPTQAQSDAGLDGFKDYAKMYCKRCGGISRLSRDWINE